MGWTIEETVGGADGVDGDCTIGIGAVEGTGSEDLAWLAWNCGVARWGASERRGGEDVRSAEGISTASAGLSPLGGGLVGAESTIRSLFECARWRCTLGADPRSSKRFATRDW